MNFDTYRDLVQRFEAKARERPRAYGLHVAALAALGYAYILLVAAVAVGLLALMIWLALTWRSGRTALVQLSFGMAAFVWLVGRAFFVRVPAPDGVRVTPREAPRLFSMVEDVRRRIGAPRVHQILIRDDYNAGLAQVPRLGVFGWHRNVLVIGLPLMEAMMPNQLRAVIGHELGHLSRQHARFSGRIYCLRQTWDHLLTRLEARRSVFTGIFTRFFRWYAPYFSAASFVLARHDEFVADACAAEVSGATVARETLVRMELAGRHAGRSVWPDLWSAARTEETPEPGRFLRATRALRAPLDREAAARDLEEALAHEAGCQDTHPSLADRLAALERLETGAGGARPALDGACHGATPESAAQRYLGGAHDDVAARVDQAWRASVDEAWRASHRSAEEARTRLESVAARGDALSEEEAWAVVQSRIELDGLTTAIPEIERFVAARPAHAPAAFALGAALLERGDESGLEHLRRAMDRDSGATGAACQLAGSFLRAHGRSAEADAFEARAWAHAEACEQAMRERTTLGRKDALVPHGLDEPVVAPLRAALLADPGVAEAFLVRREVRHLPDQPAYVLGIVVRHRWYKLESVDADLKVIERLSRLESLPDGTVLFVFSRQLGWARKRAAAIEGSVLVAKSDRATASRAAA